MDEHAPPDAPTRFFEPPRRATHIDGQPAEIVTLRARSAAVLRYACAVIRE